jgi:hypothetical protein
MSGEESHALRDVDLEVQTWIHVTGWLSSLYLRSKFQKHQRGCLLLCNAQKTSRKE